MNVNLLNSISKLEELGFVGADASLVESLFEYNLVWLEREEEGDVLFVYPIKHEPKRFSRTSFDKNTDVFEEFDWVDWSTNRSFLAFIGLTREEFAELPLPHQINELHAYYGWQEIFGDDNWEGFRIFETEEEKELVAECDKMREEKENVGLSDDLIDIVRYAYKKGQESM